MLQPILHNLNSKHIVLASSSPRRQEILKNIGLNVIVCPSLFEENLSPKDFPSFQSFVEETALQKVLEVSNRLQKGSETIPDLIIGADTIVTLNDKMYGKPKTSEKAFECLTALMGRSHIVYTGVVLKYKEEIIKFTDSATVVFGEANSEQIQSYVDTGEPLDKAGGYGIQGFGGSFVKKIDGDFFTVMGLPLYRLCTEIYKLKKLF